MKRRKKHLSILTAVVATSILSFGCNKSNADQGGNYSNGQHAINRCPSSSYNAPGRYSSGQSQYGYQDSNMRGSQGQFNYNQDSNIRSPRGDHYGDQGSSNRYMFNDESAHGNGHTNGNGNGNGKKYKYNPLNVERVKGEIVDKKIIKNPDGSSLVMFKLKTDNEEIRVIIGPSSFLDRQRIKVQLGDKVEIKGSRMQVNGDEMMIAAEINKNGNVIQLRDEQGNPAWQQGASYSSRSYTQQPQQQFHNH